MGLIDEIRGKRISIDTAPFIYFIEKNPDYINLVKPIFSEIENEEIDAVTSTITLLEVLVLPLKLKREILAEQYRDILLYTDGLFTYEISHDISEMAAKLRVKYNIRTPDAIQIATGIIHNADAFITNDISLKKVDDIKVFALDDFL
ncbi:MAG: PIN domain-containing protein [Deltaproteobacteria bacterium]|nr:PIN domain-containing protein [Deltaproteobacteria bacterium]MBW2011402.1 PIN domain-containing protein [Deltaproteobacteria bacterium]